MISTLERLRGGRALFESVYGDDTAGQDLVLQYDIDSMVKLERKRQDEKWGARRIQSGPLWSAILTEEVGEAAKGMLQQDKENLVDELIQVMAVSSAWIEALVLDLDGISFEGAKG